MAAFVLVSFADVFSITLGGDLQVMIKSSNNVFKDTKQKWLAIYLCKSQDVAMYAPEALRYSASSELNAGSCHRSSKLRVRERHDLLTVAINRSQGVNHMLEERSSADQTKAIQ